MDVNISHSDYLRLSHSKRELYVKKPSTAPRDFKPEKFARGMMIDVFHLAGGKESSYKAKITKSDSEHVWVDNHVFIDGKREQLCFSTEDGMCVTYPEAHALYDTRPHIQVN